ncbi:MAG: DUF3347 domain-containing protein [Chitinophagaceae bacterium]|nr:DUF3347 domain-containing protein [Chitinophagaceae bacterium]
MKKFFFIVPVIIFSACNGGGGKSSETEEVPVEVKPVSVLSDAFNTSFEDILNNYYALRDALVADDTAAANESATRLIAASDGLKLEELKAADTNNVVIPTAQTYTGGISSESRGLLGEANIEAKRKSFQMISGNLFDLARTVRYTKAKIYLLTCPMAFDNAGADWLSAATEIKNPYFGSKMLTCGSVKDSVVIK